ncbi:MAG: GNAT family N-acetyltransferase [Alkalispirochaeta sp.]
MERSRIQQIADQDVSDSLDRELRSLLSTCFTRPQDDVFRDRRYWKEPPVHRWIMRDAGGDMIAHVAAHDKTFAVFPGAGDVSSEEHAFPEELRVAGIAEVCVHPAARGMGHVREILGVAHTVLGRMGFHFSALFGNPEVYRSSGYLLVDNLVRFHDDTEGIEQTMRFDGRQGGAFLRRSLSRSEWPQGVIDIRGPKF